MSEVSKPTTSPQSYPLEGICDNCLRERVDLFQHPDGNRYCADVFACEARYYVQGEQEARGKVTQVAERFAWTGNFEKAAR